MVDAYTPSSYEEYMDLIITDVRFDCPVVAFILSFELSRTMPSHVQALVGQAAVLSLLTMGANAVVSDSDYTK